MSVFLASEPGEAISEALTEALDLIDFGFGLIDRRERLNFANRRLGEMLGLSDALIQTEPSLRDLVDHWKAGSFFQTVAGSQHTCAEALEAALHLGMPAPLELELGDSRRILFRCIVSPAGGRILTCTDITSLAQERELLRKARQTAERVELELKLSNESLETQSNYLAALVDAAEQAATRAEDARRQLERQIAERREMEAELRLRATTDGLTGVLIRREFLELAEREVNRARQLGQELALFMVDVDLFKQVNDRYGHRTGDQVLQHLAKTIRGIIRRIDLAGRLGGEEFAVALPAITPVAALSVAERLRAAVENASVVVDGHVIPVSVSIGVALSAGSHDTLPELCARADAALYRAKQSGRNRVCVDEANRPEGALPETGARVHRC